jgi:hypothetical protein
MNPLSDRQQELRKTGPVENDEDTVLSALYDVEDLEQDAKQWPDGQEIMDRAGDAAKALDDLHGAVKAWFERHPE